MLLCYMSVYLFIFLYYSNLNHVASFDQNPTWRSLDFGMLPDLLDTSVSCFVVRIWGGQEEQYQLLIEWKVNLDGLRYTGQQVSKKKKKCSCMHVCICMYICMCISNV